MSTPANPQQVINALARDRSRLAEQLQQKARHADVLERHLRRVMARAGLGSDTVVLDAPLLPRGDAVSLARAAEDGVDARYRVARPTSVPRRPPPDESWWPSPRRSDKPPLAPSAGWMDCVVDGRGARRLGFSVCGLDRAALEHVLEMVRRQLDESRDFVPVFLYDGEHLDLFRSYGYVVEWLPPPAERQRWEGHIGWDAYLGARRALIERKWGLARVVCFGGQSVNGGFPSDGGANLADERDAIPRAAAG